MQTETNASTSTDSNTDVAILDPATTTEAATPVKAKRAPKAAKPATEAAPVAVKPVSTFADERAAAALAVSAFYSGASLPFKAASASLSPLNPNNAKRPSPRTAALVAAMLAYAPSDAIGSDGTFQRGAFRVPARMLDPKAPANAMLAAMPESGCLGNMLGRVVHYVSGPLGGKTARDATFRLDFAAARTELAQLGDVVAKPALAVLKRIEAKRAA